MCTLWPGFNSHPRRSISRDFSLTYHTLPTRPEPAWQKMAQSPFNNTTQPVDSEEEGTDRRWLIKKRLGLYVTLPIEQGVAPKSGIQSTVLSIGLLC